MPKKPHAPVIPIGRAHGPAPGKHRLLVSMSAGDGEGVSDELVGQLTSMLLMLSYVIIRQQRTARSVKFWVEGNEAASMRGMTSITLSLARLP